MSDNLGQPFGVTATILARTKTGKDSQGNATYTWADQVSIDGCVMWPRSSSELVQAQDTVLVGQNLLLPADAPTIAPTQRIRVAGIVYEVDGEPGVYVNPIEGTRGGTQVALTRVEG